MLFPVSRYRLIDFSVLFVKNRLRVAILASWSIHSLPDIKLFSRASVRTECQLVLVHSLHRNECSSHVVADGRLRNSRVRSFHEEGILVVIKIRSHVCVEI